MKKLLRYILYKELGEKSIMDLKMDELMIYLELDRLFQE